MCKNELLIFSGVSKSNLITKKYRKRRASRILNLLLWFLTLFQNLFSHRGSLLLNHHKCENHDATDGHNQNNNQHNEHAIIYTNFHFFKHDILTVSCNLAFLTAHLTFSAHHECWTCDDVYVLSRSLVQRPLLSERAKPDVIANRFTVVLANSDHTVDVNRILPKV